MVFALSTSHSLALYRYRAPLARPRLSFVHPQRLYRPLLQLRQLRLSLHLQLRQLRLSLLRLRQRSGPRVLLRLSLHLLLRLLRLSPLRLHQRSGLRLLPQFGLSPARFGVILRLVPERAGFRVLPQLGLNPVPFRTVLHLVPERSGPQAQPPIGRRRLRSLQHHTNLLLGPSHRIHLPVLHLIQFTIRQRASHSTRSALLPSTIRHQSQQIPKLRATRRLANLQRIHKIPRSHRIGTSRVHTSRSRTDLSILIPDFPKVDFLSANISKTGVGGDGINTTTGMASTTVLSTMVLSIISTSTNQHRKRLPGLPQRGSVLRLS